LRGRIGVYDTPAAESGKSGAWRNAYLAIVMLKVDMSRRHEVAVKMKKHNKSGHEIKAFLLRLAPKSI
jgi:hypothetical protein